MLMCTRRRLTPLHLSCAGLPGRVCGSSTWAPDAPQGAETGWVAGHCVAAQARTGLVVVAAQNTKQRQRLAIKERTYNRQYKSAVRTRMKKVLGVEQPDRPLLLF